MARVPVLVTRKEQAAYSYLEGPAVVWRNENENEMQALARLRRDRMNLASSQEEWQAYEDKLLQKNVDALRHMFLL